MLSNIWFKNIIISLSLICLITGGMFLVNNLSLKVAKNEGLIPENKTNDYIGYLVIKKINMYLGFYDLNDTRNNVDQNIEVLSSSKEGSLFIAGHSGTGNVSFFNNLRYLALEDEIIIYFHNQEYHYMITDIYKEIKDGDIRVMQKENEKILVLTTCDQISKGYQLVIKAVLQN